MLGADPFGPRDTITVRDSHPSPVARYRGRPHYRISWHALPSCSARRRCGRARASRSSSFKRPGWTGSGFIAFCNKRGSRAMAHPEIDTIWNAEAWAFANELLAECEAALAPRLPSKIDEAG